MVAVARFAVAEFLQPGATGGLSELQQTPGFDLADAFPCDAILPGDFIQGAGGAVPQAEAEFDDLAFARGEGSEHFVDAFLEQSGIDVVSRGGCVVVGEKVFQGPFAVAADWFMEADGVAPDGPQGAGFLGFGSQGDGDLFAGGLAAGAG